MNPINHIKRVFLILILIINVILGAVLAYITIQISRYRRLNVWIKQNDFIQLFYSDLQDKIVIIWVIWGLLFVLSLIYLIIDFSKKREL